MPVYTTVTDESGQLVLDLTQDDFEIRDNGKPQEITQFSMKLAPMTGTILIDGSQSVVRDFDLLIGAADAFIVRMMPGDRVRIGSFAEDVRLGPAPTDDRDELIRFLRNPFSLRMGIRTRLWDAIDLAIESLPPAESRRVVLVLTDGQDTFSVKRQPDVISRAMRNDVMVYAIRVPPSTFEPKDQERRESREAARGLHGHGQDPAAAVGRATERGRLGYRGRLLRDRSTERAQLDRDPDRARAA